MLPVLLSTTLQADHRSVLQDQRLEGLVSNDIAIYIVVRNSVDVPGEGGGVRAGRHGLKRRALGLLGELGRDLRDRALPLVRRLEELRGLGVDRVGGVVPHAE